MYKCNLCGYKAEYEEVYGFGGRCPVCKKGDFREILEGI